MGRKVFISFLGLGNPYTSVDEPGYDKLTYSINNKKFTLTRFAQRTILEYLNIEEFDKVVLLMTEQSKERHRNLLVEELKTIGLVDEQLYEDDSISTSMKEENQWAWFESLLAIIENGDEVTFDFTHGFRSVPIIFSTAISFLQKVKDFTLEHAFYGYMQDKKAATGELVDMANFYRINEWADGVSQLIDTADASKLALLAKDATSESFKSLKDNDLIESLKELTAIIKNVDVNHIAEKADKALSIIRKKMDKCGGADKQLLEMVVEKFKDLATAYPPTGDFDEKYFNLQLILIRMLNKHKLFMQSFTVMRELIGSIGMLAIVDGDTRCISDLRHIFAEGFLSALMLKANWDHKAFSMYSENDLESIKNFTERFFIDGLGKKKSKSLVYKIKEIRNGFDHAWTSGNEKITEIEEVAEKEIESLENIILNCIKKKIIKTQQK